MKVTAFLLSFLLLVAAATAQVASPPPGRTQPSSVSSAPPAVTDLSPLLSELQQRAQAINLNLARLRVDKWKADSTIKQQMQGNVDALSRNLGSALPAIIDQVRANPQSLAATFKLYRNLNALSDVLTNLSMAADTFAPRPEADTLATDANSLDRIMRTMGDNLEKLAATKDTEVVRLRTQVAQAATPPPPPKKIVIDDEEKPKKTTKTAKKTVKKPAAKPATDSSQNPPSPNKPQ